MKNNQWFTFIAGLLFIFIGAIGFSGYYVLSHNQNQNVNNTKAATNQYTSNATGLSFAYPSEWGTVSETNEVERCADSISQASATVLGKQYSYSFSGRSETNLYVSSADFAVLDGIVHCFPDTFVGLATDIIESNVVYANNKIKVYAEADSCIGPVEKKHLKATIQTGSNTFPRVGVDSLDSVKLQSGAAESICAGANITPDGLEYTEILRNFVESISL